MAEFVEVMEQKERMCEYYGERCVKCKLSSFNNGHKETCDYFIRKHPQEAEPIIMDWAKEHPVITNADKFEKVFGVAPFKRCPNLHSEECKKHGFCEECIHYNFWEQEWKEPKEKADE